MELKVFLLADYANIGNDKLNILGVFDTVTADQFPVKHHSLYLAIKVATDQQAQDISHSVLIQFLDEDEKEISSGGGEFTIPKSETGQSSRAVINFAVGVRDLVFEKPARYECRLLIDDQVKGSIPLDVVQLENSPQVE